MTFVFKMSNSDDIPNAMRFGVDGTMKKRRLEERKNFHKGEQIPLSKSFSFSILRRNNKNTRKGKAKERRFVFQWIFV